MSNHEKSQMLAPESKRARQRPVPAKEMAEALVEKPVVQMKTAQELLEEVEEMKKRGGAETPQVYGAALQKFKEKKARRLAVPSERVEHVAPQPVPKSRSVEHAAKGVEINLSKAKGIETLPESEVREVPSVGSVTREVQAHFLNDKALAGYVNYLEGELGKPSLHLERIELPSGETLEDIGWGREEAKELLVRLQGQLEEHERLTSLRKTIGGREAMNDNGRGASPEEQEEHILRQKLNENLNEKYNIQEQIDNIKKSQSVIDRIGSLFGAKNPKLQEYQARIEKLDAEANPLAEELQMLTYRRGLEQTSGVGVKRGAAATPQKAIEKEAREREERLAAEQEYGKATAKTAEELELEIAGPAAEMKGKEFVSPKKLEEIERQAAPKEKRTALSREVKASQKDRDWVVETLGRERAMQFHDDIQNRMKMMAPENPEGYTFTAEGYVTNLARWSEAMQQGTNKTLIKEYAKDLQDWNKELGYPKDYNPLIGAGASRLKESRVIGGVGRARTEQAEAAGRMTGTAERRGAVPRINVKEDMEVVTPEEQEATVIAPYETYLSQLRANPLETTKAIPNAAELWTHLTKQMNVAAVGKRGLASGERARIKSFSSANIGQDATDMILNLAAFKKATEEGNVFAAQKYQDAVATIAHNYLLQNDPELIKAYNLEFPEAEPPKGSRTISAKQGLQGVEQRRATTRRSNTRWKT